MKKSIIFGVNGYLGKHFAKILVEQGDSVSGYDVQPSTDLSGISYCRQDLTQKGVWEKLDLQCDRLFWLCGLTGVNASFERYDSFLAVNELSLLHLLNALRFRSSKPRILFPSTRLVYRGAEIPLQEDAPKVPKTLYAVNKLAAENVLSTYRNAFDVPYTILRICVPYGSLFGAVFSYGTMGLFYKQAVEQKKITIWGDGGQRRTFTHVSDVCRQAIALTAREESIGEIYNCAGETFSMLEIAKLFSNHFQVPIEKMEFPEFSRRLESGSTVFASGKIERLLGPGVVTQHLSALFQQGFCNPR